MPAAPNWLSLAARRVYGLSIPGEPKAERDGATPSDPLNLIPFARA